jgi:hypothetical protein
MIHRTVVATILFFGILLSLPAQTLSRTVVILPVRQGPDTPVTIVRALAGMLKNLSSRVNGSAFVAIDDDSVDDEALLDRAYAVHGPGTGLLARVERSRQGLGATVLAIDTGDRTLVARVTGEAAGELEFLGVLDTMAASLVSALDTRMDATKANSDTAIRDNAFREWRKARDEVLAREWLFEFCPGSGIVTGRSMASWNRRGPMTALPLTVSVLRFSPDGPFVRAGFEYLVADLGLGDAPRSECSVEIGVGLMGRERFRWYIEAGLALTMDWNGSGVIHAWRDTGIPADVYPAHDALSLGLPFHVGLLAPLSRSWDLDLRFSWYGLAMVIDPVNPPPELARIQWAYGFGCSPWGLLDFGISCSFGVSP